MQEDKECNKKENADSFVTIKAVAKQFQVSEWRLRTWIKNGWIRVIKPIKSKQGSVRVSQNSVEEFIRDHSTQPKKPD